MMFFLVPLRTFKTQKIYIFFGHMNKYPQNCTRRHMVTPGHPLDTQGHRIDRLTTPPHITTATSLCTKTTTFSIQNHTKPLHTHLRFIIISRNTNKFKSDRVRCGDGKYHQDPEGVVPILALCGHIHWRVPAQTWMPWRPRTPSNPSHKLPQWW